MGEEVAVEKYLEDFIGFGMIRHRGVRAVRNHTFNSVWCSYVCIAGTHGFKKHVEGAEMRTQQLKALVHSSKGSKLSSQHMPGNSQPVTSAPVDLMSSSGICRQWGYVAYIHTVTPTHK